MEAPVLGELLRAESRRCDDGTWPGQSSWPKAGRCEHPEAVLWEPAAKLSTDVAIVPPVDDRRGLSIPR